jgi:hypothetical protein
LAALTAAAPEDRLGDANTLFSIWQRVAGSLGVGSIAALFTTQSRAHGSVSALHATGLALAAVCAVALAASFALPVVRNRPIRG